MDFISNNNKAMVWGLLQDSNAFEGIENEKYNLIQKTFEETIHQIHRSGTNIPLLEKNKMAMNELITKINKERNNNRPNNNSNNNNHIEKPLEMIYTASDLQNQRANEMSLKLKEQQDSMNTLMNPTKPKDVNFSDTSLGDDKPIGDEMDKLIAERMASRERELEVPPITKETEQWLNTNTDTVSISKEPVLEKKVSFDSIPILDTIGDNQVTNILPKSATKTIVDSIFSKLKRKNDNKDNKDSNNTTRNDSNTMSAGNNSNIVDELKIIRETQEQLKNTCNQILEILQNKNIA